MKLGIVTYNIAADWDLETIIDRCQELGYDGVELRTTHAHGVEVGLSKQERQDVKKRFEDSAVTLVGLGSAFEFHSPDPDELEENIEGSKEYAVLARDVGAQGIKVRPNAFPDGVPKEKTIEQVGRSLGTVAEFAAGHNIKVRLEVHGGETCHPPYIRQMLDIADHPNIFACWNSNLSDRDEQGSIDSHFELLKDRIGLVHINQLSNEYPWRRLFQLLGQTGYDGFCLAEIAASTDAETVLRYYRTLFLAWQPRL